MSGQSTKRYAAEKLRLVLAGDRQTFALEFITVEGEHVSVVLAAPLLRQHLARIEQALADNPDFGKGPTSATH